MVKVFIPLYSLTAHGWPGRVMQKRLGVQLLAYPISVGRYHKMTSYWYNTMGWCYQRRRTWHGCVNVAMRGYTPYNPRTPQQQSYRATFAEAVHIWKAMNQETKDIYEKWRYPEIATGYTRFISFYIKNRKTYYTWSDDREGWSSEHVSWAGFAL
jgi:hypothetical protein